MAERKRIQAVVVGTEKMLWGSLGAVYRRCGKPTCHCAIGENHGPVFYLTRGAHGRTRNIHVPAEQVAAGVAAYRRYRELGQEIAEANAQRLGLEKKKRRRR